MITNGADLPCFDFVSFLTDRLIKCPAEIGDFFAPSGKIRGTGNHGMGCDVFGKMIQPDRHPIQCLVAMEIIQGTLVLLSF